MKHIYLLLIPMLALSACASIVEGTKQNINVNTTPEGARCSLIREGSVIATVESTPGSVMVDKLKHDITVECIKDGYEKSVFINESGAEGATFGNILAGGVIGWGIDSATGADNKYNENVHINMVKK